MGSRVDPTNGTLEEPAAAPPSVDAEPGASLALVVDVPVAAHVDDDLVDLAAAERERRLVVRRDRRCAVARPTQIPSPVRQK